MHVLLATQSCLPSYGGPAFLVCRLAHLLTRQGHSVTVWAADGSAVAHPQLAEEPAITRLNGRIEHAFTRSERYDVVHDHGIWLPFHHRLARLAQAREIPRVVSIHGMLDRWCFEHKPFKKRIAWRLYQRADLQSAAAHHVTALPEKENVERFALRVPVELIPLGVDLPAAELAARRPRSGPDRRVAAYLGRLHPVKGLPLLLEAWATVRPENWELRIAGPNEAGHRQVLERIVSELDLRVAVSFVGAVTGAEKEAFLSAADLFVLPSRSESFGLSIAEALSYAVPVLTTTATPWSVLDSAGCGWSVDPDVSGVTKGLADATSCLEDELRQMGRIGRDWVECHLQWGDVADQFVSLYRRAAA